MVSFSIYILVFIRGFLITEINIYQVYDRGVPLLDYHRASTCFDSLVLLRFRAAT